MRGLTVGLTPLANDWLSLTVEGELDLSNVEQLKEAVDEAYEQDGTHLLVDLTDTSFMDSTGLKSLISSDQRFRDSGRSFAVVVKRGPISRLIDITGLGESLDVVSEPEDVLTNRDLG